MPSPKLQVRTGRNTETFRTSGVYEQVSEDCAFSIIYGEMYESLDLVANSAEVANIWVTGLRYDTHICLMIFRMFGLLILTFLFVFFKTTQGRLVLTHELSETVGLTSLTPKLASAQPSANQDVMKRCS